MMIADDPLQAALLGGGLAREAVTALRCAAESHADSLQAELFLAEASRIAPDHPAVLIGQYRYYFYKNRLLEAVVTATKCLLKAARDNGLKADWRTVGAGDAAFGDFGAALPRFYLFSLKAYAYLRMRMGDLDEGRDAVMKLLELDPSDKIGARVLLDVLNRAEQPHAE